VECRNEKNKIDKNKVLLGIKAIVTYVSNSSYTPKKQAFKISVMKCAFIFCC